MKLDLPKHDVYDVIRLRVNTPCKKMVMCYSIMYHPCVDIVLPEGVHSDEVEVWAQYLENSQPVDSEFLLKAITESEPEKCDEDTPVEAEEEVAQSPPSESDYEKVPEVRELPEPREFLKSVDSSKKSRRRRNHK